MHGHGHVRLLSSVVGNTLQVPLTSIVHELEVRGLVVAPQMLTQLICSNRKVAGAWAGLSAWYLLGPLVE